MKTLNNARQAFHAASAQALNLTYSAKLPPHDPERWQTTDGLTEYGDSTNGHRAECGRRSLASLALASCRENVSDLISELLHHAHSQGMDIETLVDSAMTNFLAEAGALK